MPVKRQHILYWIITTFILLLTLLIITLLLAQRKTSQTTDVYNITTALKVTPGQYYQTDGLFHLDMTGTSKVILPIKRPPDEYTQYRFLVINRLFSNQAINVYLTAQIVSHVNQPAIDFKQRLNTNHYSVNQLNPLWTQAQQITEVALEIESELTLGFGNDYHSEISWQSILFSDEAHIKPLKNWFYQMTSFEPLGFASVNVHDGDSQKFYRLILSVLAAWLLICFLVFCVLKPAPVHFISILVMAWFFMSLIYGLNFNRQIDYNQQRFAQNSPHLNKIDHRLYDMAEEISQSINEQMSSQKTAKILIHGGDKFNQNRLNYHLLQHNVGLLNPSGLDQKLSEKHDMFLILLPPNSNSCSQYIDDVGLTSTKPLIEKSEYCLVSL